MRVERYNGAYRARWDVFVRASRNGSFLFLRDYMEYHEDRFEDHSLVFLGEQESLVAVLPANRRGAVLESHGGLTFGGIVSGIAMTTPKMLEVFDALLAYLRRESFALLRYRAVPHIYHRTPAEEDLFALIRHGARVAHRAVLSVLDLRCPIVAQDRRRRGVRRALEAGLVCGESEDLDAYWSLLEKALLKTYGAKPVHTREEIALLRRRLPSHIRLFGCFRDERLLAGVLVYEAQVVARAQYIAASDEGKRASALDLLFDHLLRQVYAGKSYFDFGTSESPDPSGLNQGVLEFKESHGARAVVLDTYELAAGGGGASAPRF